VPERGIENLGRRRYNRWFHNLLAVDYCCAFNFSDELETKLTAGMATCAAYSTTVPEL
jgi:hypothetical protein